MKRLIFIFLPCLALWIGAGLRQPVHSQGAAPIEVFALQDFENARVDIYFANPITGLSTVVSIDNFTADLSPLNEFTLTANGVIFRNPADSHLNLITPNGLILDVGFIPRQTSTPIQVLDWVLSQDRKTIAWAEVVFNQLGWQGDIYTATLDGQNLRVLPGRPLLPVQATHRLSMLGVSNDGQRVFFDSEFPVTLPEEQLFKGYQRINAYVEQVQGYFDLPGEPNCICPALITRDGQTFMRLKPAPNGEGFDLSIWNLENNRERLIPGTDMGFGQVGNLIVNQDGTLVAYMVGDNTGFDTLYGIVLVDFSTNSHRLLTETSTARLRPVSFIDSNAAIVVVDTETQTTYKLRLETGELLPVANKLWLGTIQG
jgi:hypothetical protein